MERCETGSFKRGLTRQRAAHLRGLSVLPRHALRVLGRLAGHEREGCWGHAARRRDAADAAGEAEGRQRP